MHKILPNFLYTILLMIPSVFANASETQLNMVHRQILPTLLSEPGRPTSLEVALPNNRDLSVKVTAEILLDGVLINIPMEGSYGTNDRTIYRTVIKAPITEMVYQFHAESGPDNYKTTEKFKVARDCEYQAATINTTISKELSGVSLARKLSELSRELENESQGYSDILTSLKRIEEELQ